MPCIEQKAAELVEAEERWRNEQSIESAASLAMAEPEPLVVLPSPQIISIGGLAPQLIVNGDVDNVLSFGRRYDRCHQARAPVTLVAQAPACNTRRR